MNEQCKIAFFYSTAYEVSKLRRFRAWKNRLNLNRLSYYFSQFTYAIFSLDIIYLNSRRWQQLAQQALKQSAVPPIAMNIQPHPKEIAHLSVTRVGHG